MNVIEEVLKHRSFQYLVKDDAGLFTVAIRGEMGRQYTALGLPLTLSYSGRTAEEVCEKAWATITDKSLTKSPIIR